MNLTQSVCWHLPRRPAAIFQCIGRDFTVQSKRLPDEQKDQTQDLEAD